MTTLANDVVELLLARGFKTTGHAERDGQCLINQHTAVRASGGKDPIFVSNLDMARSYYARDVESLTKALDAMRDDEELVTDAVRALANEVVKYFADRRVVLALNYPKRRTYEFYTAGTHSSVKLFSITGEMVTGEGEIELTVIANGCSSGNVTTAEEVAETFTSEFQNPKNIELYIGYTITLDPIGNLVADMLHRGLRDIVMTEYEVIYTTSIPFLKNLVGEQAPKNVAEQHFAFTVVYHDPINV